METVCPYCDNFFDVLDELEGTRTLCPFCDEIFTVDPIVVLDMGQAGGNPNRMHCTAILDRASQASGPKPANGEA